MAWIAAILLAAGAFAAVAFVFRVPRIGWSAVGAALLFGLAGYGLQGRPDLPGHPTEPRARIAGDAATQIALRRALAGGSVTPDAYWVVVGDALSRHGQYGDAAGMLLGAVDRQPRDVQAWIALGNALVAHADGVLTPAAAHAFREAGRIAPEQPGPPFFLGMALAQSGRFAEARVLWAQALAVAPAGAPSRAILIERLQRLDLLIAAQAAQAGDARAAESDRGTDDRAGR